MKIKIIASLFCLLFTFPLSARLFLDIKVVNQKGVDKGLTLTSELHIVQEVREGLPFEVSMKNGLKMLLSVTFVPNFEIYGPSSTISISGKIFDKTGTLIKSIEKDRILTEVGDRYILAYKKFDRHLKITFIPKLF